MTASLEYTDWHITPSGWKRGTAKLDNGTLQEIPTPIDRIATYRYSEEFSSVFSRSNTTTAIIWKCVNQQEYLSTLLDKYGACPDQL